GPRPGPRLLHRARGAAGPGAPRRDAPRRDRDDARSRDAVPARPQPSAAGRSLIPPCPGRKAAPAVAVEHEVAAVLLVHLLDRVPHLALETVESRAHLRKLVLERDHARDAGEVQAELRRQALDQPKPVEVVFRVQARAAGRAPRADEALRLVDAQRLRVHADEVGGDRDHVARAVVLGGRHRCASLSCSSSSRSFFESFFGTSIFTRAIRSPRPEPLSCGAPLPRTRSSFPSVDPAGIFTDTFPPTGVGTLAVVPSAASVNGTCTSTSRSLPRRWNVFEGSTRVTT